MNKRIRVKFIVLGMTGCFLAICLGCAAAEKNAPAAQANSETSPALIIPPTGTPQRRGYDLFMLNCAHCHGDDARGDEGPDLHGVLKSDARVAALIKNGVKGEMPKFSAKLNDADVQSLVAFVRSLRE